MDGAPYKYGKKAARLEAIKMRFAMYSGSLPKPPSEFGHDALVNPYHMLGNDKYGCCFWSGAAHETYVWTAESGERSRITTRDVLDDYTASTGFEASDPTTDQGTDLQQGAAYRQKTGIIDAIGRRHKIGAYVSIQAGNIQEHKTAAWLFGAVGLGVLVGDAQQDQFTRGVPWDGAPGPNQGGHYVPLVAFRNGLFWVVTWGRLQAVTPAFLTANNDESIAYLSSDMLIAGKSLENFDLTALTDDLSNLTKGA